ncbi:DUF892 family protein [Chryseolinea sp. T2]
MKTSKSNSSQDLSSKLGKLFEDELKDIYWAEKALTKAIPKMIRNSSSQELINALRRHLNETEEHVVRAAKVFEMLGRKRRRRNARPWTA